MALAGRPTGTIAWAPTTIDPVPATIRYNTQDPMPTTEDTPTAHEEGPGGPATLVQDMRPDEALKVTGARVTHHIVHARTGKTHRPDPAEEKVDQKLWKAPCGWRYGGYRYYRQTGTPPPETRCRKCWRDETHNTIDDDALSVASSSGSSDSSTTESSS